MLLRLAAFRVALAVRDVALRDIVEVILHELLLDHVLDLFDRDILALLEVPFDLARDFVDVFRRHLRIAVAVRARDGMIDFLPVVGHCESRAFRYRLQHGLPRLPDIGATFPPRIYMLWSLFCLTGMFLALLTEFIDIVFQLTIIIAIRHIETAIRIMIDRPAAKQADRIGYAISPQITECSANRVIHAAVAKTKRRTTMAYQHLIVGIVVMQTTIGYQCTSRQFAAIATNVIDIMLQAIAVTARILAAVILNIKDGVLTLALLQTHRQITCTELLARAQHTNSPGTADI